MSKLEVLQPNTVDRRPFVVSLCTDGHGRRIALLQDAERDRVVGRIN